mmetsp:Transcript_119/g.132  ORF Transcript_119/g.132 Transcript_119/m.132 type:complete len:924 (+) Transcript_119:41-2812(+)
MVSFGKSLKKGRRSGWEAAYLDYKKLKKILLELEKSLTIKDDPLIDNWGIPVEDDEGIIETDNWGVPLEIDKYGTETDLLVVKKGRTGSGSGNRSGKDSPEKIKEHFFQELGEQIEKISLFTLDTQGVLSGAIGRLRFRGSEAIKVATLFRNQDDHFRSRYPKLSEKDDLEMYLVLGVELLYLIQFVSVNTIGVRKVLKRYNSTMERSNKPDWHYIMGGNDDFHLKQMSSSQSLAAVHSSLQSALMDFYRNHTDALLHLDPGREIKYLRLQSIVQASYVIRKNTEIVNQPFRDFLSRKAMINSGGNLGGIEGSEMRALATVLNFRPGAILGLDIEHLDDMWAKWIPQYAQWKDNHLSEDGKQDRSHLQEIINYAMEVLENEENDWHAISQGALMHGSKSNAFGFEEKAWDGADMSTMILNLCSMLLYTINYYIVSPTANRYALQLGADEDFGATLIGMSSVAAIIAAFLYSFWYTNASFKSALIFSTICPLVGNVIYAMAIPHHSVGIALYGRFLCGFGSAEVINRQLISTCVSLKQITRASALFVASGFLGMSIGPLIAGILDTTIGNDAEVKIPLPFDKGGLVLNSMTSPGFFMASLWLIQLIGLIFFFHEPDRINGSSVGGNDDKDESIWVDTDKMDVEDSNYGSFSGSQRLSQRSLSRTLSTNSMLSMYSERDYEEDINPGPDVEPNHTFLGEVISTCSLVLSKPGLIVTLLLYCYIELADEVLISSCSMIVHRYFGWSASGAGFLIASLGALVLPAMFLTEIVSHTVTERKIMKVSICMIIIGCFGIINFEGLKTHVSVGVDKDVSYTEFPYDWGYGEIVYIFLLNLIFSSTIVLEGVTTSIMVQVTPTKLNACFINSGLLATLIGTIGRVFADVFISFGSFLDSSILIDLINAMFVPLLLLAGCGLFLVNMYYSKLI